MAKRDVACFSARVDSAYPQYLSVSRVKAMVEVRCSPLEREVQVIRRLRIVVWNATSLN